jgi:ankyrin repeat protein
MAAAMAATDPPSAHHLRLLERLARDRAALATADRVARRTALHWAAAVGNLHAVRILATAGARLEARDRHGRTPLFLAAHERHHDVAAHLVACGADTTVTDYQGRRLRLPSHPPL